jgi:DNA mismatch repair protein MutL
MATAPSWADVPEDATDVPPLGFAVAQLAGVYILAENKDGLVVIDIERITYERLKQSYDDRDLVRQPLLVPETVSVAENEANLVEEAGSALEKLGLVVDRSGPTTLTVREVPALLRNADVESLLRDVLSDISESGQSSRVEAASDELLSTMACHHSVRANRLLSLCASARNGSDRACGSVQPWPPDVDDDHDGRTRPIVPARPLGQHDATHGHSADGPYCNR